MAAKAKRETTTPRKRGVAAKGQLPPLPAEQAHAFKELARRTREAQTRAVSSKELDRALLDRALAAEIYGRQLERKKRRKAKRLHKPAGGWQADLVHSWLLNTYPPHGKTPYRKTQKALRDEMSKDPHVITELKRTGRALPSEDTIGRVVDYLGYSD